MATTPEGKVKKAVSALLAATPYVYYFMPVPGGFGESTLDYIVCHMGRYAAIETKAPGKKPTDRQRVIISMIERAGGKVFVIDGTECEGMTSLREWLG